MALVGGQVRRQRAPVAIGALVVALFAALIVGVRGDESLMPAIDMPSAELRSGVYFEPNVGQAGEAVDFTSSGPGYTLSLAAGELHMTRPGPDAPAVTISFAGANADPPVGASQLLTSVSNYYPGGDPEEWIEGVPHFGSVTYSEIYPGIDLVVHGRNGNLEYDFVVEPGVDPAIIAIDIAGVDQMSTDAAGNLWLGSHDPIQMKAPFVYQGTRDNVIAGDYVDRPDGMIGFDIGDYDATEVLVIDPELVFSTFVGGPGDDFLNQGSGADATGAYNCFGSTSNELSGRPTPLRDPGRVDEDVVCTKHDPDGQLVYATNVGGAAGLDGPLDFTSDASGRVHVTGQTTSDDYPTTPDAFQTELKGVVDAFVFSLDSSGALEFSSYIGGSLDDDRGHAVFAPPDGTLYVGGTTPSDDFLAETGVDVRQLTDLRDACPVGTDLGDSGAGACYDNYLIKLTADRSLEFVTLFGGGSFEQIFSIGTDSDGVIYTSGYTNSDDFPVTDGAFQAEFVGGDDIEFARDGDGFVTTLDASGSSLLYSTFLGGSDFDFPFEGGTVDEAGNFYIAGSTESPDFPTTSDAYQPTFGGVADSFIAILRPDGKGSEDLVYSTFVGGSLFDTGVNIEIDQFGNAYVVGGTDSPDFPTTPDAYQQTKLGIVDAHLVVLNPGLPPQDQLLYSSLLGGEGFSEGRGLGADGIGNVYVYGATDAFNFPTTPDAFQPDLAGGGRDTFVSKFHIWQEVGLDIKPRNGKNRVVPRSNGVFPVAILSSTGFFAPTDVERSSIRVGGAEVRQARNGRYLCNQRDVNRDGLRDLVCRIETSELRLAADADAAVLIARTIDGDILVGRDSIRLADRRR